jgi:hypothetical protein
VARRGSESLRGNYPSFNAFGVVPRLLTADEAIGATTNERIGSVWLYLVRRANKFVKTLRPYEQSNFDVEDVLMELYVTLAEKDAKWEPDRGRYITFAGKIADRALTDIRDRSRTVESPRNSSCRMRDYQAQEEAGTLTDRRLKTFDDVRRSSGEYEHISVARQGETGDYREPSVPPDDHEEREDERMVKDAVTWGLMALTTFEARCLGEYAGLWGRQQRTIAEIARRTGRSKDAVKKARDSANDKIRRRLYSMGHPAVASDN